MDKAMNSENLNEIIFQRLDELKTQKDTYSEDLKEIEATQNELKAMSHHPRHKCLIPVSNYVYSDATLISTEYLVKHSDYRMITSQQQTYDYIDNIKKDFQTQIDDCHKEIGMLESQISYLSLYQDAEVTENEHGTMITRGEFVEIIEKDDKPINRERVAKVKNAAERDTLIKNKLNVLK